MRFLVVLCVSFMVTTNVLSTLIDTSKIENLSQSETAVLEKFTKEKLDDIKGVNSEIQGVIRNAPSVYDHAMVQNGNITNGCNCVKDNCGCCTHLKWKFVKLDEDLCTNVSYIPSDYGVSVTVTLGNHVIINETVSARNPPPLCIDIPELKKLASLCIKLHDLDVTKTTFTGCIAVEARLALVIKESVELGCFKIPV